MNASPKAKSQMTGISMDTVDGGVAQAMIDSSPACIKLLEPDGSLSYMSTNGLKAMEIDDFTMVKDQLWWNLWPEQHRQTLIDAVGAANRGVSVVFEADCPTAKGSLRDWRVNVSQIRGGEHDKRLLAVSDDISDLIRVQRVRDRLQAENAALDRFSHLLVHDLKNPLRHISLLTELLDKQLRQQSNDEASDISKLSSKITGAAQNLLHMVAGLRSLSGMAGDPSGDAIGEEIGKEKGAKGDARASGEETQAIELLKDAALLSRLPSDALAIDNKLQGKTLLGNRGLLLSLFKNLFENAIKYAGQEDLQLKIHFLAEEHDLLLMNLSDNGVGIPDDERNDALKPSRRLSNAVGVEGTGMGLSLVDRIARSHGGWIEVLSQSKRPAESLAGASFTIALPFNHI